MNGSDGMDRKSGRATVLMMDSVTWRLVRNYWGARPDSCAAACGKGRCCRTHGAWDVLITCFAHTGLLWNLWWSIVVDMRTTSMVLACKLQFRHARKHSNATLLLGFVHRLIRASWRMSAECLPTSACMKAGSNTPGRLSEAYRLFAAYHPSTTSTGTQEQLSALDISITIGAPKTQRLGSYTQKFLRWVQRVLIMQHLENLHRTVDRGVRTGNAKWRLTGIPSPLLAPIRSSNMIPPTANAESDCLK